MKVIQIGSWKKENALQKSHRYNPQEKERALQKSCGFNQREEEGAIQKSCRFDPGKRREHYESHASKQKWALLITKFSISDRLARLIQALFNFIKTIVNICSNRIQTVSDYDANWVQGPNQSSGRQLAHFWTFLRMVNSHTHGRGTILNLICIVLVSKIWCGKWHHSP